MAKFKKNNVELRDSQKIIFDSTKEKYMSYDGFELYVNNTISGVSPSENYHLVTKEYSDFEDTILDNKIDTASGTLQNQIDNIEIIFGSELGYASSETESTTTNSTPQQKVRLSKTSLPSGTYHIDYSTEYARLNDKNSESNVRVQINDTTTIASHYDEDSKGGAGLYHMVSGMYEAALSGNVDIDLDYYDTGGGTTGVRRSRISIWRVA
jgi:hypothetical protein